MFVVGKLETAGTRPHLPLPVRCIMKATMLPTKKYVYDSPSYLFLVGGPGGPQTPLLSRDASPLGPLVLNFSEYEPCRTCSLEVYTIFPFKNLGIVYYFRLRKPWKCLLFSDLKTLEVFTIFGSENLEVLPVFGSVTILGSENCGSVHYFRI